MIILLAIILLFVIDMLLCLVYCTIRSARNTVNVLSASADEVVTSGDSEHKDSNLRNKLKRIYAEYRHAMDCVLRPSLLIVAYIPSHHVRNFLYKRVFKMNIEKNAVIYYGVEIRAPWNISIGRGSIIGDKAILDGRNGILIGENVNISTGASMWTMQHDVNDPMFKTCVGGGIQIEDRAWVSCNTVILPEVKVGEGSVIAAGAVVTKDTEPYTINGGVPCHKIGNRSHDLLYEFDGKHMHFL